MSVSKFLIELGKAAIELGTRLEMQDARLDSLGARREPPKEGGEITDVIRDAIIRSRAECSEEDWLRPNGRRDQECVRYGITTESAAAILAGATKREKKNGNGNVQTPVVPVSTTSSETLTSPAQKTGGKNVRDMFDPNEWGEYPLETGGMRDQIPAEMFRAAMQVDKDLVIHVYTLAQEFRQDWNALRFKLCCTRRLTRQQVAAIIAEHTKQVNKNFAAKAAHA